MLCSLTLLWIKWLLHICSILLWEESILLLAEHHSDTCIVVREGSTFSQGTILTQYLRKWRWFLQVMSVAFTSWYCMGSVHLNNTSLKGRKWNIQCYQCHSFSTQWILIQEWELAVATKREVHRDRKKLCCLLSLRILYDVKRPRVENCQLWIAKHHRVV